METLSEVKVDDLFGEASRKVYDLANELKFGLEMIDPTLLGPLEHTQTKVDEVLTALKNKTVEAQRKRHEIALRQISRVSNSLFPDNMFQERFINIIYYMNKYGLNVPQILYRDLQIDQFQHQLLTIE